MLEYDNSAFYYFALTLLSFYLIPGTWFALSEVYYATMGQSDPASKARTGLEKDKAAKLKKENTGMARLSKWSFIINLVCLVISLSIFIYLISLVINDGEVSSFDPYQILGIEMGAAMNEIKKAHRKLSLKYHPDKNPGNKFAEDMFIKVSKAYESLTDETARENYEKYGNPDGKQALEVSIGLPRMILDNPKVVLVFYLIAMVVIIPAAVGLWYANSKQYGEKNVLYETYNTFYQFLTENHRVKMLPEVLAASAECRKVSTVKEETVESMGKLYTKLKVDKLMNKPKYEHPTVLNGNLLLHAHLMRMTDMITPAMRKDLDKILTIAPELIDGMIEIAYQRRWLQTTLSCIRFSQHLVQALWHSDHSLQQLPHFTDAEVKHVSRGSKVQAKTLSEYLRVGDVDKKGLAKFTPEQVQDVYNACKLLPRIKVELKLFVEEDEDTESVQDAQDSPTGAVTEQAQVDGEAIYEQDLVTLRVTITRENVSEGESAPAVHAPHFPVPLKESWWILLTDKPKSDGKASKKEDKAEGVSGGQVNIHAVEKISDQSRVISHEVRFLAPNRAGDYAMDLFVCSDCYMGLDEELEVKFKVLPAKELPEYEPHKEDAELDNDPTLFEMMMAADAEDSSDDDDDKDDDDEEVTDAQKRRREQRKARKTKTGAGAAEEEEATGTGEMSMLDKLGVAAAAAAVVTAADEPEEEEEEDDEDEDEDADEDVD